MIFNPIHLCYVLAGAYLGASVAFTVVRLFGQPPLMVLTALTLGGSVLLCTALYVVWKVRRHLG